MAKRKNIKKDGVVKTSRTYPERECANNKQCISGGKYIPHDRRQKFCCSKCGENFRNDLRSERNSTIYIHEKYLRTIDKKLGKLYQKFLKGNIAKVNQAYLIYEDIDPSFVVRLGKKVQKANEVNLANALNGIKNPATSISWYYQYGLARDPNAVNDFIIYKRIYNV